MMDHPLHIHYCTTDDKTYKHSHALSGVLSNIPTVEGHEHLTIHGIDEWVSFNKEPAAPLPSEEDELQSVLGFDTVGVTYEMKKRKHVNQHVGSLETLQGVVMQGGVGYSSCIVCRCGWVMAYEDNVSALDAVETFQGHAQPGAEWITD